jgi:hypothetical protein
VNAIRRDAEHDVLRARALTKIDEFDARHVRIPAAANETHRVEPELEDAIRRAVAFAAEYLHRRGARGQVRRRIEINPHHRLHRERTGRRIGQDQVDIVARAVDEGECGEQRVLVRRRRPRLSAVERVEAVAESGKGSRAERCAIGEHGQVGGGGKRVGGGRGSVIKMPEVERVDICRVRSERGARFRGEQRERATTCGKRADQQSAYH